MNAVDSQTITTPTMALDEGEVPGQQNEEEIKAADSDSKIEEEEEVEVPKHEDEIKAADSDSNIEEDEEFPKQNEEIMVSDPESTDSSLDPELQSFSSGTEKTCKEGRQQSRQPPNPTSYLEEEDSDDDLRDTPYLLGITQEEWDEYIAKHPGLSPSVLSILLEGEMQRKERELRAKGEYQEEPFYSAFPPAFPPGYDDEPWEAPPWIRVAAVKSDNDYSSGDVEYDGDDECIVYSQSKGFGLEENIFKQDPATQGESSPLEYDYVSLPQMFSANLVIQGANQVQ